MKEPLTHCRLKSVLEYNSDTGIFIWKHCSTHRNRRAKAGSEAGGLMLNGYVTLSVDGGVHLAHRLAWFYTYGVWPIQQLDHKDMVRSHNWISNLREASNAENNVNRPKQSNNTSGYKGVDWSKSKQKWRARCSSQGRNYNLGHFDLIEDAIKARAEFAKIHHGEFYRAT